MPTEKIGGTCACGAVRYEVSEAPALSAHCHCRHCQQSSGAAYATVFAVPRGGFRLLQGKTQTYAYQGDSGNSVVRHYCPTCGSPLFTEVAVMPELWFVRTVSLDQPQAMPPAAHIYCDSAQPWDLPDDGLPRFAKLPG